MSRRSVTLCSVLLLSACSGPELVDSADTAPVASSRCLAQWADQLFEPDPDGPDTQLHGTSVFDGDKLWMAWNRPNEARTFDVWLARYGCDGQLELGPIAVSDSDDNEIDPSLAVSGDRLLVAWSSSTTASADNLDIRYRIFDLDGETTRASGDLVATRDGVEVTGNATLPRVGATTDGFVLAGSWGHEAAPAFQAFSVRLDAEGEPLGDAVDAELDTDNGQTEVDLAVDDGELAVAWREDSNTSTAPSAWRSDSDGVTLLGEPGARPALVSAAGELWSAWDDDGGTIWLRPPDGSDTALDLDGFAHSARLAAAGDTVAMVSMRVESGLYNGLELSTLDPSGVLENQVLDTVEAPSVYGVDLTLVDPDHAVVVWQEGENPDFRLRAKLLTLAR